MDLEWDDGNGGGDVPAVEPGGEPFRRDERQLHYSGFIETRILLDPCWIQFDDPGLSFTELKALQRYARHVTVPTKVGFVYPKYLQPKGSAKWYGAFFRDHE